MATPSESSFVLLGAVGLAEPFFFVGVTTIFLSCPLHLAKLFQIVVRVQFFKTLYPLKDLILRCLIWLIFLLFCVSVTLPRRPVDGQQVTYSDALVSHHQIIDSCRVGVVMALIAQIYCIEIHHSTGISCSVVADKIR